MYNRTIEKSFFEVLKFCFAINLIAQISRICGREVQT